MSEESSSKPPFPEKYESSINIKKGSGEEPAEPRQIGRASCRERV